VLNGLTGTGKLVSNSGFPTPLLLVAAFVVKSAARDEQRFWGSNGVDRVAISCKMSCKISHLFDFAALHAITRNSDLLFAQLARST
jgi:hypothetical protein